MNKIPTAKEWFSDEFQLEIYSRKLTTEEKGIEFAKLHVKAALNNIKKETQLWDDCAIVPYEKIIYSLENIK